ncbi:putative Spore germination protein, amino acid permease [Candidatus Desulfosporosinus infrequens]|uniref:Putative Spore germination protein, amino acid permease n=1 Tax=Candidatus Desulfosporosinus infrequens TaxID=2043169 RepID=A0A2U3KMD6_9FIRM|nr:putative Spore germination protein, amino acid permease [Candidatus Desulfosporosinus infrequens]
MIVERISSRQFTWLTITACLATCPIILPTMVIFYAKQSAWLALVLATILNLAGVMLNLSLAQEFPGQTVAQYAQVLLGSWLGKLIGFFYTLAFLYNAAICSNLISQVIQIYTLPETPLWPFVTGLTLLAVYSAWQGVEPIARANDLILPINLLVAVIAFLLVIPNGKLYQALPVFQLNFTAILKGTFPPAIAFGEVFFILQLAPVLNKQNELRSSTLKGVLFTSFFLIAVTQTLLFALGAYRASIYFFPAIEITEELHIMDVFERFEPLILSTWLLMNIIKISLMTYLFALSAAHTMHSKTYKGFLLPALVAIPIITLAFKSLAETLQFGVNLICFQIMLPTSFLILPGVLFIVAKVKKHYV